MGLFGQATGAIRGAVNTRYNRAQVNQAFDSLVENPDEARISELTDEELTAAAQTARDMNRADAAGILEAELAKRTETSPEIAPERQAAIQEAADALRQQAGVPAPFEGAELGGFSTQNEAQNAQFSPERQSAVEQAAQDIRNAAQSQDGFTGGSGMQYSQEQADALAQLSNDTLIAGAESSFSVPYNRLGITEEQAAALRSAGLLGTETAEDGSAFEYLNDAAIYDERQRRREQDSAARAQRMAEQIEQQGASETAPAQAEAEETNQKDNYSTYINTDPETHTPEQMKTIREYVAAVDEGIKGFVNRVKSLTNPKYRNRVRHSISEVSHREAARIQDLTGIDATDFENIITGGAVDHIENRHGEHGKADKSMADINDIARAPYILNNFDEAYLLTNKDGSPSVSDVWKNADNSPAQRIIFYKDIDGTYYIAVAAPDSKSKVIAIESLFIGADKNKGPYGAVLNMSNNDLQVTSETPQHAIGTSDESIRQTSENSNPQNEGRASVEVPGADPNQERRDVARKSFDAAVKDLQAEGSYGNYDYWQAENKYFSELAKISGKGDNLLQELVEAEEQYHQANEGNNTEYDYSGELDWINTLRERIAGQLGAAETASQNTNTAGNGTNAAESAQNTGENAQPQENSPAGNGTSADPRRQLAEAEREYKEHNDADDPDYDYRAQAEKINELRRQIAEEESQTVDQHPERGEIGKDGLRICKDTDALEAELNDAGAARLNNDTGEYKARIRNKSDGGVLLTVDRDGKRQESRTFGAKGDAAAYAASYIDGQTQARQDAELDQERSASIPQQTATEAAFTGKVQERPCVRKRTRPPNWARSKGLTCARMIEQNFDRVLTCFPALFRPS